MSIETAPFYWAVCDCCRERADYGDYAAWSGPDQAIEMLDEYDWLIVGDAPDATPEQSKHYCSSCTTWDDDLDERVRDPEPHCAATRTEETSND